MRTTAPEELRFAAAALTHVVRADGRGLCGGRIDPADVYEDAEPGRKVWEEFPADRCRRCSSSLERLLLSVLGSPAPQSEEQR